MRRASSRASPQPTVEEVAEDEAHDEDAFQLPEAGGGHDFDGLQPDDLSPTRGNNRAPHQQEISADINPAQIIKVKRTRQKAGARAYFTLTTFDRCLALALIKPTVGLKLSSLPPEPRNYRKLL